MILVPKSKINGDGGGFEKYGIFVKFQNAEPSQNAAYRIAEDRKYMKVVIVYLPGKGKKEAAAKALREIRKGSTLLPIRIQYEDMEGVFSIPQLRVLERLVGGSISVRGCPDAMASVAYREIIACRGKHMSSEDKALLATQRKRRI